MHSRFCIYAHYDENNTIAPYVKHSLNYVRAISNRVIFVSTSNLSNSCIIELNGLADEVLIKENIGYDFGMWKYAIDKFDVLNNCTELVLFNSSVIGPFKGLKEFFENVTDAIDFWGFTDWGNLTHSSLDYHIQSYFMVFREQVVRSKGFIDFWRSVIDFDNKNQIIRSYEYGLTQWLMQNNMKPYALFGHSDIRKKYSQGLRRDIIYRIRELERKLGRLVTYNYPCEFPMELIDLGYPFIKKSLLTNINLDTKRKRIIEHAKNRGYTLNLNGILKQPI